MVKKFDKSKNPKQWSTKRRIITGVVILLVGFLLYWLLRLGIMYLSIEKNAEYWKQRATESGQLTYVAFGDSAAQGIGASSPTKGYVGLIAERYAAKTRKSVRVINLSKSGAKNIDVLRDQLPAYEALKNVKPDLVTIEIGANDMSSYSEQKFTNEFRQIVAQLPSGTYVSDLPDYGSEKSRHYAVVSAKIQSIIDTRSDLQFVPLGDATVEKQKAVGTYAYDFFHPNNDGYEIWADAFWSVIEPDLNVK